MTVTFYALIIEINDLGIIDSPANGLKVWGVSVEAGKRALLCVLDQINPSKIQ